MANLDHSSPTSWINTTGYKQKAPQQCGGLFLLQKPTLMSFLYFVHELQVCALVDMNQI